MDKNEGIFKGVYLTPTTETRDDSVISVAAVVNMVGDLCLNCQEIVRRRIAGNCYRIADAAGKARMARIIVRVAAKYGITPEEVVGGGSRRELVRARKEIAQECRTLGYSYPQIGAALKKHHSTIIYLVQKCKF